MTLTATAAHRVTRDDALASARRFHDSWAFVTTTSTVHRPVTYRVIGSDGQGGAYALSGETNLVVWVTLTGHSRRDGRVSARVHYPRDTGDAAGTLAFDASDSLPAALWAEHFPTA
jgi:hypothetical protein